MKRSRRIQSLFLLLVVLFLCLPAAGVQALEVHGRYPVLGKDYAWSIQYEDAMLLQDGTAYHQDLARASLGMALSAFRVHAAGLQHRGVNIQKYFTELGFSNTRLEQFNIEPTIDTIATAMAMKAVGEGADRATVIAIAVSGGGYVDEWKSNFLIGNGIHHQGFDQAAQKVAARLQDYIDRQDISGRIKVWISGYSRAAATSNRTAAILLNAGTVKPADLYAYTFATPNVTRQATPDIYPSIFNIIGSFDPVPLIPFDDWGFSRYGKTFYLPTPEADSDFRQRLVPVNRIYRKMTGEDYWTSVSRNRTIQKLLSSLGDAVTNTAEYTKNFQPLFMNLMDQKKNPLRMVTSTIGSFFANNSLWKTSSKLAGNLWTLLSNTFGETMLQQEGVGTNEWRADTSAMVNLGQEHVPTGYVAWLMAYDDPAKLYTTNLNYRQVSFTGEQRVRVLDEKGVVVLTYRRTDGAPQTAASGALTFSPVGDAMVLTLPADLPYTVEVQTGSQPPPTLSVREGIIGHLKLNTWETDEEAMQPDQQYSLPLAPAFGGGYTLAGPDAPIQLQQVESSSLFSEEESNSAIKMLFDRNLRRLVAVVVLAVLQVLFLAGVSGRAGRHVYQKRKAAKNATLQPLSRQPKGMLLLRRCQQRSHTPLKVMGIVLAALSLVLLGEGVRNLLQVLSGLRYIDKGSTQILVYFTELPQLLLVFMAGVPALVAALNALVWRQGEGYRLRTGRLFAWSALVCAAFLLYLMAFDVTAWFALWVRGVAVLHALSLVLFVLFIRRTLCPPVKDPAPKAHPWAAN